jgi:hypothetical protein
MITRHFYGHLSGVSAGVHDLKYKTAREPLSLSTRHACEQISGEVMLGKKVGWYAGQEEE